jgi:cold shock CspA family protein/ribosome-associated translation inhibitor RaiA
MELHWHHPEAFGEADRAAAERRVADVAENHTDLIDVRISARGSGHHRHGEQEVRITCQARGKEIVAARTRADAGLALNEALDAFEREVRRMRERRTQERKERPAPPPELGVVDEILPGEGYGFILTDAGERVYFHRNAVHGGLAFERLEPGQRVGLDIEGGLKGPQATVVLAPPPDEPGP